MAAVKKGAEKTRLLAKARRLVADLNRYASHGYVSRLDTYEADDRRLLKAIDGLYDLARKHGLGEDADIQQYRLQLREQFSIARERARDARRQTFQAMSERLGMPSPSADRGLDAYRAELALTEARRRSRLKG